MQECAASPGIVQASILVVLFFVVKLLYMQVHKILGPGNQYVTAAKMALQNSEAMISMDMPAGPSEVLVIADAAASPAHVAADLLSQAEHGPDSQVCPSPCVMLCHCAAVVFYCHSGLNRCQTESNLIMYPCYCLHAVRVWWLLGYRLFGCHFACSWPQQAFSCAAVSFQLMPFVL